MSVTHELDNGWTIVERDHRLRAVHVGHASDGSIARFFVLLVYIPSQKLVKCIHFQGATEEERARALRLAKSQTPRRTCAADWTGKRRSDGTYTFGIELGDGIDEAEAFGAIARELEDDIFSSITAGMEVYA